MFLLHTVSLLHLIYPAQQTLNSSMVFHIIGKIFWPNSFLEVWLVCFNPYSISKIWAVSLKLSIEHESKDFQQMKAYRDNKERVTAMIQIPSLKEETYGRDLSEMLQGRLTFNEALALPSEIIWDKLSRKTLTCLACFSNLSLE